MITPSTRSPFRLHLRLLRSRSCAFRWRSTHVAAEEKRLRARSACAI
ncbi:E3 ubiquitin-protein ligase RHA1B-like [Iris pallida]|uniref:E3 ubiquitin-protein ligase RHA1B-like n=1 Tax=Iris pallida TaxID=29817 RepID=A0AAX6GPJ6_IRIPA|nr:E3 ubiquitin-protein ligase RHA1B-like [Iris pallida]